MMMTSKANVKHYSSRVSPPPVPHLIASRPQTAMLQTLSAAIWVRGSGPAGHRRPFANPGTLSHSTQQFRPVVSLLSPTGSPSGPHFANKELRNLRTNYPVQAAFSNPVPVVKNTESQIPDAVDCNHFSTDRRELNSDASSPIIFSPPSRLF